MSTKDAVRLGSSSRRWMGRIGKIWSMAQTSGRDWKTEKFTWYCGSRFLTIFLSASGMSVVSAGSSFWISRQRRQKSISTSALSSSSM